MKAIAIGLLAGIISLTCIGAVSHAKVLGTKSSQNVDHNSSGVTGTGGDEELATLDIPCPAFWTVQPNPSVENSLSYVHDSGKIAVSVTYIGDQSGSNVSPETFARVAATQMNCTLPVKSNLLSKAWAFNCDEGIEALVYGDSGNLVLLSISGRNEETDAYLVNFIQFLAYHSNRR